MRKGFTLIEMLVVMGIIAVLIGASLGSYQVFVKKASRSRCEELVKDVEVAMTAVMQKEGAWPRALLAQGASGDGEVTSEVGAALAKRGALSLSYEKVARDGDYEYKLNGNDRCGVVSTWAVDVLRRNPSASEGTRVPSGGTVADHRLHFAIDDDYDGRVKANVGGKSVTIRASAAVWCAGADGKMEPYSRSGRADDVYSWSGGQIEE